MFRAATATPYPSIASAAAPETRIALAFAVSAVPVTLDTVSTGPTTTGSPALRRASAKRADIPSSVGMRLLPKPSWSRERKPSGASAPRSGRPRLQRPPPTRPRRRVREIPRRCPHRSPGDISAGPFAPPRWRPRPRGRRLPPSHQRANRPADREEAHPFPPPRRSRSARHRSQNPSHPVTLVRRSFPPIHPRMAPRVEVEPSPRSHGQTPRSVYHPIQRCLQGEKGDDGAPACDPAKRRGVTTALPLRRNDTKWYAPSLNRNQSTNLWRWA